MNRLIDTIHQFIQDERLRDFVFLVKDSHHYMRQDELLVLCPATPLDIEQTCQQASRSTGLIPNRACTSL